MNQLQELSTPFSTSRTDEMRHPLEPLTQAEVQQSVDLLRAMPDWTSNTRIISIALKEPSKDAIYAWPHVPVSERFASAVLMSSDRNRASTVLLDLAANTIAEVRMAPEGAQPTISMDEQIECEIAVLASEAFRAALERHYGIADTSLVTVDIWSAGYYGSDDHDKGQAPHPPHLLPSFGSLRQQLRASH